MLLALAAFTAMIAAVAGIIWEATKGLLRNDGFELAGAGYIAFNALLALFPFLLRTTLQQFLKKPFSVEELKRVVQ